MCMWTTALLRIREKQNFIAGRKKYQVKYIIINQLNNLFNLYMNKKSKHMNSVCQYRELSHEFVEKDFQPQSLNQSAGCRVMSMRSYFLDQSMDFQRTKDQFSRSEFEER